MLVRFLVCAVAVVTMSSWALGGDPGVQFVENRQQWPAEFRYSAAFQGARVYLSDNRLFFVQLTQQPNGEKGQAPLPTAFSESDHHHKGTTGLTTYEVIFNGAGRPQLRGEDRQPTLYNYYFGNNPEKWASGARSYGGAVYDNLYEGVSLHLYSQDNIMKSDWLVSPCADASRIQLRYNGMDDLEIREGRLQVTTCLGMITEDQPFAYQVIAGNRRQVSCRYVLKDNIVSFEFPDGYDKNYELVIDPILIFSSYSGSEADNWGNTATPDRYGNLYSGGMVSNTQGLPFPVTAGAYQTIHNGGTWDVGILKYDSVGFNLLYVTYLGGAGVETPQSLVVNGQDELLILGATGSANFPGTTPGSFRGGPDIEPVWGVHYTSGTDIFIARLSPDGTQLLSSTTLGGTQNDGINFVSGSMVRNNIRVESPLARNYGDQLRGDITVDAEDNVLIASCTLSPDFPIVNTDPGALFHGGTHDAVVVKLTPNLSNIVWSRLIGGSLTDAAYSIKVGTNGRIYVAGGTTSSDLAGMNGLIPASLGDVDGWINELSQDGASIVNGTYLGSVKLALTPAYDQIYFIDIATDGDVLAYGQTQGNYLQAPPQGFVFGNPGGGQFIHRLDANLKTTDFSTVFGSGGYSPNISPTAFLVNECDNIYVAGWGGAINSPSFNQNFTNFVGGDTRQMPITPDAYQPVTVAGNDFYMMVLTGHAEQLVYATYLGGTTSVTHVDGGTSRFDKRGIVYHAVCASCGGNDDFPARFVPAWRMENRSTNCNNAAFKFDLSSLKAGIRTNNATLSAPDISSVCMPNAFVFMNASIGGERYEWELGDGFKVTKLEKDTIKHFYKQPGTYLVKLKTIDVSTCIGVDSTYAVVTVTNTGMVAGPDQKICNGTTTQLMAEGATTYDWRGERTGFTSHLQLPMVSPDEDERYFLTMTDGLDCSVKDTVDVRVVPSIDLQYELETVYDCVERPYIKVVNKTDQADDEEFYFNFGDGTTGNSEEEIHYYERDGVYHVALVGRKEECFYESGEEVRIVTISIPNVITPEDSEDLNDVFKVVVGDAQILPTELNMSLVVVNKWGVEVYSSEPYNDDWSAKDVDEGVYYYDLKISGYPTCKGWVHVIK